MNLYNMLGVPGETFEDFLETVKMNRLCRPGATSMPISIFFPYPGTQLYERCKAEGLLSPHLEIKHERIRAVLDLPGFSKAAQEKAFAWADDFDRNGNIPAHALVKRRFPGFYHNVAQHPIEFKIFRKLVLLLPAIPGKELVAPSGPFRMLKKLCDAMSAYHRKVTRP